MTKIVLQDLSSLTNETSALNTLNANSAVIETASDNFLSRDGTTPNTMLADLDMNSNQILNIGTPMDMNGSRIIGLNDAVAQDEPITKRQFESGVASSGAAPVTPSYVTVSTEPSLPSERVLTAGSGVTVTDGGTTVTVGLDPDLISLAGQVGTGLSTRTAADTWTTRSLTQPAAGITITNSDGVTGNPTLALSNDLAAVEGLSGTGIAKRTGVDTWSLNSTVAVADGGTGASTAAVARTNLGAVNIAGDTMTGLLTVQAGTSTANTDFFQLKPSDFGTGKPQLVLKKDTTANVWLGLLWDGVDTSGTINWLSTNFQHNSNTIDTRADWATAAEYRANTASKILTTDKAWSAADIVALSDGANIAVNMANGFNFSVTLGGNRTLDNPTNTKNGQTGVIIVSQDGTGSRTLAYGTNWEFAGGTAPTLSTAASAKDVLFYFVQSSTSIIITGIIKAVS